MREDRRVRRGGSAWRVGGWTIAGLLACAGAARVDAAPPPPLVTSVAWTAWYESLLGERLAACPRDRATTYYFAQSGNDSTGDGTIAKPWKSLSKARGVLSSSAGNIALLFKRGDLWRESVGIDTTLPNVTVADYDPTGVSTQKPRFTTFFPILQPAGWTPTPGAPQVYQRTQFPGVCWVKEDDNLDDPYVRMSSVSGVASRAGSFWHDAVNGVLYIRPKAGAGGVSTDPRTDGKPYEMAGITGTGVAVSGDGSRVENIHVEGFGMDTVQGATQQQGILSRATGSSRIAFVGCESYYQSSHAIAHFSTGGGIVTMVDCAAGLCNPNWAGESVFNTYASAGGHQTIFERCVATHGTLPADEPGPGGARRGQGFYGHTDGNLGQLTGLTIARNCRERATRWACSAPAFFGNTPSAAHLIDAKVLIVGEVFEGGPGSGDGLFLFGESHARVNCRYMDLRPAGLGVQASLSTTVVAKGWVINSTIQGDLSGLSPGWYALYNSDPGQVNRVNFWHSTIDLTIGAGSVLNLDFDNNSTLSTMVNSVVINRGAGVAYANIGGATGGALSNAYAGVSRWSGSPDARAIDLGTPPGVDATPSCADPLSCAAAALPDGVVLEFDQTGRAATRTTIGPRQSLPCANCDGSTTAPVLSAADFICFLGKFRAGDAAANCDGSTAPPLLNAGDFICFLNAFRAGCP